MRWNLRRTGGRKSRKQSPVLQIEALENRTVPAFIDWSGQVNSNWNEPANWVGGVVPGTADTAVFLSTAVRDCTVNVQAVVVGIWVYFNRSITLNNGLSVTGGSLQNDGTIQGSADLEIRAGATYAWSGGTMLSTGAVLGGKTIVAAGGRLDITGNVNLESRTINNSGIVTWTAGYFTFYNGAVFNNLASSTFNASSEQDFSIWSSGGGNEFNNFGAFWKNPSTSTAITVIEPAFNNNWEVFILRGQLHLKGGGTSNSQWDIYASGLLFLRKGVFTLDPGTVFTGDSVLGYGEVLLGGIDTPEAVVAGGVSAQVFRLTDGGTLRGPQTITFYRTLTWTGGTMATAGGISEIAAGATANIGQNPPTPPVLGRTLRNFGTTNFYAPKLQINAGGVFEPKPGGTVNWHDGSGIQGAANGLATNEGRFELAAGPGGTAEIHVDYTDAGTTSVQSGGTFRFSGPNPYTKTAGGLIVAVFDTSLLQVVGTFRHQGGTTRVDDTARISVTGTVEQTGGLSQVRNDSYFSVTGSLQIAGGRFSLSDGFLSATAGVSVEPGGTLAGGGFIDANVTNLGRVEAQDLSIGSVANPRNYTQSGTAVLFMEVDQTGSDRLYVSGHAALGGTLQVRGRDGFEPGIGASYTLVTFATRTGTFTLDPPPGIWEETYGDTDYSIGRLS